MASYSSIVQRTAKAFASGKTRKLEWRKQQLLALITMLEKEAEGFCNALHKDLRKPKGEALLMEINHTQNDAINHYNNLDNWARDEKVKTNILTMADNCYIHSEPRGVCLVIGAWNYPVQLTLMPLVGAISAGNCCIVKPSEVSPATASFLEEVVPKYMDNECIHIINGGVPETQALLRERWDFILYTGNSAVAKIVYEAAAKNLTPVVLELGGKSPCFVDSSSDLDLVSRRIIWGKFVNSGQTCIAPDYVMCTPEVQEQLIKRLESNLDKFYGENKQKSESFGRIVNQRHFDRIAALIAEAHVAIGGKMDKSDNYIEPTVLRDCRPTYPAMQDEIFGPVLPIMPVRDEDEAISFINQNEKPLAMYIFSKNKKQVDKIIGSTSSGGVTVNDTIMHASLETLPFGGVGHSGMGAYHGKFSFDAFSHKRAIMKRQQNMELLNDIRYPPYTDKKGSIIAFAMGKKLKHSNGFIGGIIGFVKIVFLGVFVGFLAKQFGFDKYLPAALK